VIAIALHDKSWRHAMATNDANWHPCCSALLVDNVPHGLVCAVADFDDDDDILALTMEELEAMERPAQ
jgi:hypothetical protein